MDETGILGFVFVLLNLHFCFLLGHDFSCAEEAVQQIAGFSPCGNLSG
jgi:hypothetical protein